MKTIHELLDALQYEVVTGTTGREITKVVYDSRKIEEGCLFICIRGVNKNGHVYAAEACMKNAACVVVCEEINLPPDIRTTIIRVKDTRYAMAFISAAWFDHPAEKLKVIGVTGTKGKTTTTYLIHSILERAGYKTGLIGTIETIIGDTHIPSGNTTPESYLLQETFRKMVDEGLACVVMEVSSQGLMLYRSQGFVFDYGIFTNLAPDHIGPNEHADFEEYKACKGRLFKQCKTGIVNVDDAHCKEVIKGHTCRILTYGIENKADYQAADIALIREKDDIGVSFQIKGKTDFSVRIPTPGRFSVYNALTAAAICDCMGVEQHAIQKALLTSHIKGRIEPVKVSDSFTLLIDYAHNAMALENLLTALREYDPGRMVCVFGCGGNRARARRFEMGKVSGRLADLTVITSDNPRFEEPAAIMDDIETGIKKTTGKYVRIENRKEAIRYAIVNGRPGDIIVLAGKGHEDYQEIRGVKYPMDERILIAEILQEEKLLS